MDHYLEPTMESGRAFMARGIVGSVVMLNLLRFRATADYSQAPALSPATPISGAEAFQKYIDHALPYLKESGGELLFLGAGGAFLIGPSDERWDMAMLVRQSSPEVVRRLQFQCGLSGRARPPAGGAGRLPAAAACGKQCGRLTLKPATASGSPVSPTPGSCPHRHSQSRAFRRSGWRGHCPC